MNNVTVSEVPADAQIIDVREPSEYAQGHAQGAINIPLGSVVERSGELDTSRDVYVICQLGGRSAKAAEALESHLKPQSFTIHNISGGTEAWIAAGLPTAAAASPPSPAAAPPRRARPRPAPLSSGVYRIVALSDSAPPSPATTQTPQATRVSETRKTLVLCAAILPVLSPDSPPGGRYRSTQPGPGARTTQGSRRVWVSTVLRYLQFRL